ncbi:MAG: hypothetical protein WCG93_02810 [Paludibacter sp.]
MMLYKLTDDYLDTNEQVATLWPCGHMEAIAIIKRGEYYFLMTSGCTGWKPNQGKYAYSKSITGPWSELLDIANSTTFDSQSTFYCHLKETKQRVIYTLATVGIGNNTLILKIFSYL